MMSIDFKEGEIMGKNEKIIKENKNAKKTPAKGRFNKKNELLIILLSAALSFTVFFFSPMEIFLGNQKEFVVGFKHMLFPMLGVSLLCMLGLILIFNLLLWIRQVVFDVASRLMFGFLLAIYTQSLFLNSKMTAITGDDAKYTDNTASVAINLVILSVILLLPLVLYVLARILPKNKVLNAGKGVVIPYVSGLIFVMQLCGNAGSMISADFGKYEKLYTSYLSYEPTMSLSEDENIVVFLSDRLDSLWMDEALKRYPDMYDEFEGFTFYQNNVAHNTNTFPSIAQMLTAEMYKGTEWADYVSKAWESETVPKKLTENGYRINLLIDNLTTYSTVGQLDGQCDNISSCDNDEVKINYFGSGGIVPTMTRLSLAKLSPYAFKSLITLGLGSNLSADFVTYTRPMDDMLPMAVGLDSDLKYYDYLKENGLTADSDKKTFSFIHLNGAHDPEEKLAALYSKSEPVNRYSTIRGDFEILFYYFDQMKKLGIYDNSTIIVLGDHGRAPVEIEVDDKDGLESAITTALLVKPAGAQAAPMKLDRNSELSNDFFAASILEYAGIDHADYGYSYNDVIENELHPDRYLQTFDFGGYGRVIYKALYKINGDARDFDNWELQEGHE